MVLSVGVYRHDQALSPSRSDHPKRAIFCDETGSHSQNLRLHLADLLVGVEVQRVVVHVLRCEIADLPAEIVAVSVYRA